MDTTAASAKSCPVDMDLTASVTEALARQVARWSNECQAFLEWQRGSVLASEIGSDLRRRHETVLRRLMALGRMLNAAASDPEFMDRRAAEVVTGRLAQLQESWDITHPSIGTAESEAILAAHFKL